ncbi:alkaline-phosphatase-like protein [Xylogone sp. PMI_703]|nr:alkaline-phosphatase-like protein [Xylogone sp. PMI_703]
MSLKASPGREGSLLSPTQYDDDASSIHSDRSAQDTDSEDDEVLQGARTSAEIRAHDRSVLLEEEERNRLLEEDRKQRERRGSGIAMPKPLRNLFSKSYTELPTFSTDSSTQVNESDKNKSARSERRRKRGVRRQRRKERLLRNAANGEDGELLYELEGGSIKEGSSSGDTSETEGSSEADRRGLQKLHRDKATRRQRFRTFCFIHLLIALGFSILVLLSWKLSLGRKLRKTDQTIRSNGTALFGPTTILVSLDGFRADFLNRGLTPRLNAFIKEGISPIYMLPSFPSVTFPNHHTIITGLYPESHGIVGNTFWDPELQEEFHSTDPLAMQSKWWGGEPLWVTAETQGIRTAIHMWPGSEAHIMHVEPSFIDKYNGNEPLPNKVNRIFELLDKPGLEKKDTPLAEMRPQFIAAYVPNVDSDGHLYGPNSTEIRTTISDVDRMLDTLFKGLEERNLTSIVNVVVVSDHGMATTSIDRLIQLDDIVDMSLIEHSDGWPLNGLRPKDPRSLQSLYDQLSKYAASNPGFDVYLRDTNMPKRYHFTQNERIAPLWIVPKTGWAIVPKTEFNIQDSKEKGVEYHPRGLHGYDHENPLMRAIFVARGPAFPHKPNSRVEPFQNIEVYNILCDSLGLEPKPNNGTLRLPLKPVGLHSADTSPADPADPPSSDLTSSSTTISSESSTHILATTIPTSSSTSTPPSDEGPNMISISPIEASSAADPNVVPPHLVGVDPVEDAPADRPVVDDGGEETEKGEGFWEWVKDKIDHLKDWVSGLGNNEKGKTDGN